MIWATQQFHEILVVSDYDQLEVFLTRSRLDDSGLKKQRLIGLKVMRLKNAYIESCFNSWIIKGL